MCDSGAVCVQCSALEDDIGILRVDLALLRFGASGQKINCGSRFGQHLPERWRKQMKLKSIKAGHESYAVAGCTVLLWAGVCISRTQRSSNYQPNEPIKLDSPSFLNLSQHLLLFSKHVIHQRAHVKSIIFPCLSVKEKQSGGKSSLHEQYFQHNTGLSIVTVVSLWI